MICFIYSQQCITIISSRKMCGFISSVFKKIIPNNTTPTFQEVGGVTQPRIFCWWHKNFSWYRVNHHKIDWFLLSKIVNMYDQEILQSQTADNPVAPRGRAAQPSWDTRKNVFLLFCLPLFSNEMNQKVNK